LKSSVIDVTVPETGTVEIHLLNVAGQKLMAVYSGFLTKGDHSINFENNGKLPAGLYLLQASTKNATGTIKIILE
jgi:formate-dependent nitrite reductase membrane component NrfD